MNNATMMRWLKAGLIATALTATQMASAQVTGGLSLKIDYTMDLGDEGPFDMTITSGPNAGYSFQSFCLEKQEWFSDKADSWVKSVSTATLADPKSYGGVTRDPLSPETAWLFTQYSNHALSAYKPGTRDSANSLQNAIWYLEDEITEGELAGDAQALLWVANAQRAVGLGQWSGLGNVRVINLFRDSAYTENAQDQLFMMTPVPEPDTVALLLAGLGLAGAVVRRRKRS